MRRQVIVLRDLHGFPRRARPGWRRLGYALLLALALGALAGTARADDWHDEPRFVPLARGDRPAISREQRIRLARLLIEERAAVHGADPAVLLAIASCESGLDPAARGRQGEIGLMQLHPHGLLPAFYRVGYTDPWSAAQQADFVARMFIAGYAPHWSCWWTTVAGRNPPWWR